MHSHIDCSWKQRTAKPQLGSRSLSGTVRSILLAAFLIASALYNCRPCHWRQGQPGSGHAVSGVTGPRWAVEEPRLDRLRNLLEHRKGQSRSQSGITQVNKCDPLVDDPNPVPLPHPSVSGLQTDLPLWWMAPFFDKSSFGQEASTLLLGALHNETISTAQLWLGTTQENCDQLPEAPDGLSGADAMRLMAARFRASKCMPSIVVCHSLPPFWSRPKPRWPSCQPCPPVGYKPTVAIGRAMAETDRYHPEFVDQCNRMDEIWVPSRFSARVLKLSGVTKPLIRVLPIPVDTNRFNPAHVKALSLPVGELVLGTHKRQTEDEPAKQSGLQRLFTWVQHAMCLVRRCGAHDTGVSWRTRVGLPTNKRIVRNRPYVFVSTFKWEERKGWDVLLEAYIQEFTSRDSVELYILTKPFLGAANFKEQIHAWVRDTFSSLSHSVGLSDLPTLYILPTHVTQEEYMGLLKAADAFVLPTRGEGWGLPITEAMSMGLPVIVTDWSGPAEYLHSTYGYPIKYTLTQVPMSAPWWLRGGQWAEPSVPHLRRTMRDVVTWPGVAARKGAAARQHMIEKYSPQVVGQMLADEYTRVKAMARNNSCTHCQHDKWVAKPQDTATYFYTGQEEFLSRGEDIWGVREPL